MGYGIWTFRTKRFRVEMTAEDELDLDLSWDKTGEVAKGLEDGTYCVFCAKCVVYLDGCEIAADYLGQCIYESPDDFRDHVGARGAYGSYFRDMVETAVSEARDEIKRRVETAPYVRENAA